MTTKPIRGTPFDNIPAADRDRIADLFAADVSADDPEHLLGASAYVSLFYDLECALREPENMREVRASIYQGAPFSESATVIAGDLITQCCATFDAVSAQQRTNAFTRRAIEALEAKRERANRLMGEIATTLPKGIAPQFPRAETVARAFDSEIAEERGWIRNDVDEEHPQTKTGAKWQDRCVNILTGAGLEGATAIRHTEQLYYRVFLGKPDFPALLESADRDVEVYATVLAMANGIGRTADQRKEIARDLLRASGAGGKDQVTPLRNDEWDALPEHWRSLRDGGARTTLDAATVKNLRNEIKQALDDARRVRDAMRKQSFNRSAVAERLSPSGKRKGK